MYNYTERFNTLKTDAGDDLKFFICDDNNAFSEKLKGDILKIIPDAKITAFDTISSLMFTLEDEGKNVDGLFLDIEIPDGSGIDAAAKIKSKFPLIKLVFVTGYGDEYSQDIFNCPVGYEPTAFLVKPVKEKYLTLALNKIRAAADTNGRYLAVTYNRSTDFVNENDIIYISNDKRKVTIHTINKEYTYYDTMDTLISKLGDGFCRCHKSYIVNFDYIISVDTQISLTVTGGVVIPIGKAFIKSFRERLIKHKASDKKENKNDRTESYRPLILPNI